MLSKSDLVAQPVLRLVWSLAYERLSRAEAVTFIGYSFPATDTAARLLFGEALADLPPDAVTVVGLETDEVGVAAFESEVSGSAWRHPRRTLLLGRCPGLGSTPVHT